MGVLSCTGLMEGKELQAVMLGGLVTGELASNSSIFSSVFLLRCLHWEKYKHTPSVQSLLLLLRLVEQKQ